MIHGNIPIHEPASGSATQRPIRSDRAADILGHQNKALINLALKCRLISPEQEGFLLKTLARKRKTRPDYTAVALFEETRILSQGDVSFLFAVREHLEMKMLDKKFGELGVANRFVEPESVQNALDIQSRIFKETSQSKLIGDILLENKEITPANKAAILLTQDRIKSEYLAEAMNDIAASELERLALNMRFGAIAVKKGFITLAQLNQALDVQQKASETGEPRRYLGAILQELFDLSPDQLDRILQIQKELEKKRLSLEKALEKYRTETRVNKRLAKMFECRFSKNKLEAWLERRTRGFEQIQVAELTRWVATMGIVWGLCPDKAIQTFLSHDTPGETLLIARGRPPVMGRDGSIEYFFDLASGPADDKKGEAARSAQVQKGDTLARQVAAESGQPGRDVSGYAIACPEPVQPVLNCGAGVIRKDDLYIAEVSGIAVLYQGRTLFVKEPDQTVETQYHTGDLDQNLQDRYAAVHLKVNGSILAQGRVRCCGLEVTGSLHGQVSAAGDVVVRGDIGDARPDAAPAVIRAEGDVHAGKLIINAIIFTEKSLKAPNADLVAAAVQASGDIVAGNVLNTGPRPCVLQAGNPPGVKADGITVRIRAHKKELADLLCTDQIQDAKDWLAYRMEIKDNYLAQQGYFKYLLALIEFAALEGCESISQMLAAAQENSKKWPDLPPAPQADRETLASFWDDLIQETCEMPRDQLKQHIREQADIKYGMYKAAVNACRRYTHEFEAKIETIQEQIDLNRPQIDRLKQQIRQLTVEQDAVSYAAPAKAGQVPSVVRVKNKVAKGAVIKGMAAVLTVDKDIFGVKFTESVKTGEAAPGIVIEGFYD